MSGSDIRDILQITKPTESSVRRLKQPTEKRPEGFSRELYSLIGGAPPVAFVQPTYKAKFNIKKKAVAWVYQPFTNPVRADDLVLQHWIKASDADDEYLFAKFNKITNVIEYTDEEYDKYLSDTEWSKEETDYFFKLCRQYDLRFPVIADRYDCGTQKRTIEDLKDRYYSIYRKLLKERPSSGQAQEKQALIQQYSYDKAKEVERKQALLALFSRTKEQMEEEEALMIEAKRIEANETRLCKERENLLNFLQLEQLQGSPAPGGPAQKSVSAPGSTGIASGNGAEKKKKKQLEEIVTSKKGQKAVEALPKEKLTPGVYVRSQKLPTVKPTMQQKVLKALEELSVGTRPVMPTAQVCHKFDALQNSILNMFELKKVVDKMEMEHKVKLSTSSNKKRSSSTAASNPREKRRA
ncbi:swr complex subunit [Apophysomyces ossiformis]|uniref:SWR1-complex protein 4 n=1 Tax=Apophysomyces ossiformis TaxID=679940 RepID=A0A8H7EQ60_9FUNG|nr:swr complex subunit [Apophysomyces ossiformis]